MQRTITFFFILSITIGCSQKNNTIPEIIEYFKNPILDDSLTVELSTCKYFDEDIYIVNSDYIIYENCNTRKYLYADLSSFRFPKYNERGFFALDKNGIYFRGKFIKIDTTGFKIVGRNNDYKNPEILWKTKKEVYKNTKPINVSDVASFESIECYNSYYYKDKNYVYFFDEKINGSDGSSVIKSCDNSCFDKNYCYFDGKIRTFNKEKVIPINDIICKTSKYVITKNNEVLDMDVSTIKRLSRAYAIDKNHVYYGTEKLPIKPADFKHLRVWDQVNRAYISDGKKVYSRNDDLKNNFDAKTFWMLPHSDFCVDNNGIYQREWIEERNEVIYVKFPFKYKEPVTPQNTFITSDSRYIVYENQAYSVVNKILSKNLTEKQIGILKENKVFVNNTDSIITSVEKEFDYLLTKQNNKIYWNKSETIADAESFTSINYIYYKDKNHVYYYSSGRGLITIKWIDVNTVKLIYRSVFGDTFFADKDYVYSGEVRLFKNNHIELLGVFTGYRMGCGEDETPKSNYYLFKNLDGFWLVLLSDKVIIRNLGITLDSKWNKNLEKFEIK